jgi:hypothetical protein
MEVSIDQGVARHGAVSVLVGCTCTKTPVLFLHSLFSIFFLNREPICFQHFNFHDWSKLIFSCLSLLSLCSRHMVSNMFGISSCNKNHIIQSQYISYQHLSIMIMSYREVPGNSQHYWLCNKKPPSTQFLVCQKPLSALWVILPLCTRMITLSLRHKRDINEQLG